MSGRVFELARDIFYQRFCATSLTQTNAGSYASSATSLTAPAGNNVFDLDPFANGAVPNGIMLKPFGNGGNGATFVLNVCGWKQARSNAGLLTALYTRETLYQITCTLNTSYSNSVGGSSFILNTTDYFCDTIAIVSGYGVENVDYYFQCQPRSMYFDTKSCRWLELQWVSGTMTSVNAMIQFV